MRSNDMNLYNEYDKYPGDKQCKVVRIINEDKILALTISYEYIPEKPHIWAYICIEIIKGERNHMRLIDNLGMDESKLDYRKRMYEWFKTMRRQYNLSWYTSKKMMMLASKAFERVFKRRIE